MSENLASFVTDSAEQFGDRPALKLDDTVVNYALLNEGSARIAELLKEKGLERGDRVGIMLPNVPYFAIVYYGVLRAGGVVVPMNVLLKGREVAFYLEDPGAKVLFAWHDFGEAAGDRRREGRRRADLGQAGRVRAAAGLAPRPTTTSPTSPPSDTAVILYTSGTTGTPKGAELTHGNLQEERRGDRRHARRRPPRTTSSSARCRCSTPSGRRAASTPRVDTGACLTLIPRFDPAKALEIIERDQVTVFEGVPTMYVAMLNLPDDKIAATPRACGCACPAARRCRSRS